MRTLRKQTPRDRPTSTLDGTQLAALVRQSRKRATTSLEVELIVEGTDRGMAPLAPLEMAPSGSVEIRFDDELIVSRTKIDRDAMEPLPRPPRPTDHLYPPYKVGLGWKLCLGVIAGAAAYVGLWLFA